MSRGMRISQAEFDANQAKRSTPPGVKVVELPAGGRTGRPAKNKYGAIKEGASDSRKESRQLAELRLLEKSGEIHDLIPHVTFTLIDPQIGPGGRKERAVKYKADAIFVRAGRLVVRETKSVATARARDWPLRRKMFLEKFGIEIEVE